MDRLQNPVWYFAGFGLAGLFSVVLLPIAGLLPIFPDRSPFLLVGVIFGLAITVCLRVYVGFRSALKTVLWLAACATAFYLSIFSADLVSRHLHIFDSLHKERWGPTPEAFFVAGWVGGFVILAAIRLLLFPGETMWRVVAKSVAWSLGGALLGILGEAAKEFRAQLGVQFSWLRVFGGDMPLLAVWQTGMALVLASMLYLERQAPRARASEGVPLESDKRLSFSGRLFFAVVLVLLVYFVIWEVRGFQARKPF